MGLRDIKTPEESGKHFGLIGTPLGHSLSPVMHTAAYTAAGVDWSYKAIECATEEEALHQIALVRTGRLDGLNVTMPYKRLALDAADYADAAAQIAGGANVLVRRGFDLWAYNTDGEGAVSAIEQAGAHIAGMRACVCGTGPTACAIAHALAGHGAAEVVVFSRDVLRAQEACLKIARSLGSGLDARVSAGSYVEAWRIVPGAAVFVDATPLGMGPDDPAVVDTALFHTGQVVMDVVYGHGVTRLIAGASAQGATCLDGLGMLVEQAALAIRIWQDNTGYRFDIDTARMRGPADLKA